MEKLISPDIFGGERITAFFTGKRTGADIERLSEITPFKRQNIFIPIQKHTDKILVLVESEQQPGIADAVVTKRKGILIGVRVADCAPILLFDPKKEVIGAVHAGWRGTAAEILKKTLNVMIDRFCSSLSDILVAIGPCIRWCCYHVGYEVIEAMKKVMKDGDYYVKKGEKYCFDLAAANKYQTLSMGIPSGNIWMSEECTRCLPEKYYSYRYAKGLTGRQGGFIGMQDSKQLQIAELRRMTPLSSHRPPNEPLLLPRDEPVLLPPEGVKKVLPPPEGAVDDLNVLLSG